MLPRFRFPRAAKMPSPLLWCAAAVLALIAACSSKPPRVEKPAKISDAPHEYAILHNAIVLNHKQTDFPLTYATLVAMIGKPTHQSTKDGTACYRWDGLGIAATRETKSKYCNSVTFVFKRNYDHEPSEEFRGVVVVNQVSIAKGVSTKDLAKAGLVQENAASSEWNGRLGNAVVVVKKDAMVKKGLGFDRVSGLHAVNCFWSKWYLDE